jgi:hypothetical protein
VSPSDRINNGATPANPESRIEEDEVLDITAQFAKSPIAATGKTTVDLFDHQRNAGVVEALYDLAGFIPRIVVHHHHTFEVDREPERLETGRKVIDRVVAHDDSTNAHRLAPDWHENRGRQDIS